MGTLYVVGTPIGNLEDISPRALRVLKEVRLIAAEDTRHTAKLLNHYGIPTRTTSYFEHNKLTKLDLILETLASGDVALVSDAGMPGLSDPGYELIRAAVDQGHPVVPVPGASAVLAALVVSGLPTDSFTYLGFLPRKSSERKAALAELEAQARTLVAFEAPHRLLETLEDVRAVLGDRPIAVARELTKVHEEVFRGSVSRAIDRFTAEPPRGEIVLVIAGAGPPVSSEEEWDDARIQSAVADLIQLGLERTEAVRQVAEQSGRGRREVYKLALKEEGEE